jgi:predicted enzyme related to lactoylglutathione lyase
VFATLLPRAGDACVRVQVVGSSRPGAHVDLHVDQVQEAAGEVVRLGGSVVRDGGSLVVVRSPAGVVFCLVPWRGESVRPGAVTWPGGQTSVVDQVSLDVPVAGFEREAGFWAALTGWQRCPSGSPEFDFLRRPPGLPLRLLLQRVGSPVAGVHVDFACDDVDAEVERHVGLGAVVVRRVPGEWTTLRDPVGREYCVTGRPPVW